VAVASGPETSPPAEDEVPPWFDAEALEGAGWTPGEIRGIRLRWEEYEMAKLEVENDRARKVPGWKHLGKRSFQIEVELRRDLGDEDYEAMRYATSQPNRVILSELLETSPAAVAGLEPGDEVVSYDGQRIFTASALKLLTLAGVPGALTEMRVLRAGEEHRFFVPRGPLGTRLEIASRAPYSR
jgi:membrane-associated protease RseP (regulator of RpoE activity)